MLNYFKQFLQRRKLRRLKTVQPLSPPPVTNLRRQAAQPAAPLIDRCKAFLRRDGWALGGSVILVLILSWYGVFSTGAFQIRDVQITGTRFINPDQLRGTVNQYLTSRWLHLIARDTYFTAKPDAIKQLIADQFGQQFSIETINVTKDYPHTLQINLVERTPSLTWVTQQNKTTHHYRVDRHGIVTQVLPVDSPVLNTYPTITDTNRSELLVDYPVVQERYVQSVLEIQDSLETMTQLTPLSYSLPTISCQQRQYVAEKIFANEIASSTSADSKAQKRNIQERLQTGEITVDESLQLLDALKKQEEQGTGNAPAANTNEQRTNTTTQNKNNSNSQKVTYDRTEWQQVDVAVACDIVAVAHDVHVHVTDSDKHEFDIYIDTTVDIPTQLQHVASVLQEQVKDIAQLHYIDARVPDRVYFK